MMVVAFRSIRCVEERVPGKQGLKPRARSPYSFTISGVEERVRGKQGLKQDSAYQTGDVQLASKSEFQENKD